MQVIYPLGTYLNLGLTQPHPRCSTSFTKIIINALALVMKKITRNYPFWAIAAPWDDTTTSSLIFIIHQSYYQCNNFSDEKIEDIPHFETYLTLGITPPRPNCSPSLAKMIVNALTSVIKIFNKSTLMQVREQVVTCTYESTRRFQI